MQTRKQASNVNAAEKRQTNHCACGKRISRHATSCRTCHKARMEQIHAEAKLIVANGTCPTCGAALRRNNALTGWWQCSNYGNGGNCSFQCFTE